MKLIGGLTIISMQTMGLNLDDLWMEYKYVCMIFFVWTVLGVLRGEPCI